MATNERLRYAAAFMAGLLGVQVASLMAMLSVDHRTAWLAISVCGVAFSVPGAVLISMYAITESFRESRTEADRHYVSSMDKCVTGFMFMTCSGAIVWFVGLLGHLTGFAVAVLVLAAVCAAFVLGRPLKSVPPP